MCDLKQAVIDRSKNLSKEEKKELLERYSSYDISTAKSLCATDRVYPPACVICGSPVSSESASKGWWKKTCSPTCGEELRSKNIAKSKLTILSDEQIQKIDECKEKLKIGELSILKLSKITGLSGTILLRYLSEQGIELSEIKQNTKIEEIYKDFGLEEILCGKGLNEFRNLKELSEFCGVSSSKMKRLLLSKGVCFVEGIQHIDTKVFTKLLETNTLVSLSNVLGVTVSTVKSYITKNKIKVQRYHGKKLTTKINEDHEVIKKVLSENSLSDSKRVLNTSRNAIVRFCKENDTAIPTSQFEVWKENRNKVERLIPDILELNKTMNLLDISERLELSYQVLKEVFSDSGHELTNHSVNKSKGEISMLNQLNELFPDAGFVSVKRRHNNVLREIDCYSEKYKLGIEYCGEYWHDGADHKFKYEWCKEQGIKLITIFDSEWKDDLKRRILISMIRIRIGKVNFKLSARKLTPKLITSKEAREFHDGNHFHGYTPSSVSVGLCDNDKIVSVLSLSKNRFNKLAEYEIVRFSTILDTIVVGGLSKLLKYAVNEFNINSILTFSDLRFGEGNSYINAGFEFSKTTPPNYKYFKNGKFYSRQKFQKHKLKSLLQTYDPNLTEMENMRRNKYYVCFDCGNNMFIMNKRT